MHTHARLINDASFLNGPECSPGMGVSSVGGKREKKKNIIASREINRSSKRSTSEISWRDSFQRKSCR